MSEEPDSAASGASLDDSLEDPGAVDYEGTDFGCLIGIVVGALLLAAIPFGGVVGVLFGWVWAIGGKNERAQALRHRLDEPVTPLRQAMVGERVTVVGKVRGPAEIETPLRNRAVVADLWLDRELSDDVEDPVPTWTKTLGKRLVLEGDGGRVVIEDVPRSILSEKVQTTSHADGSPPAYAPLSDEERASLTKGCEQYGERWLEPDMEVLATGVVGEVVEVALGQGGGYRDGGRLRQLVLHPIAEEGTVRVSTYSPGRVAQLARQGKASVVGGALMALIGLVSMGFWARFFWA